MIAEGLLIAAGIYLLCGLVFAIPFVLVGVAKIDPNAAHGSWGFRLLIIPGTMFLWPLRLQPASWRASLFQWPRPCRPWFPAERTISEESFGRRWTSGPVRASLP